MYSITRLTWERASSTSDATRTTGIGRRPHSTGSPRQSLSWRRSTAASRAGYAQDFLFNEAYVARARALAQLGRYDKAARRLGQGDCG